jgi:hypothetical protein
MTSLLLQPDGTPAVLAQVGPESARVARLFSVSKVDGSLTTIADLPGELLTAHLLYFEPGGPAVLRLDDGGPLLRFDPRSGAITSFEPLPVPARFFDAAPTADGGSVAVALSNSESGTTYDTWLVRYSRSGSTIWSRVIATRAQDAMAPGPALPQGVRTNAGGEILVFGTFFNASNFENDVLVPVGGREGFSDVWVAKYDAVGRKLWVRQMGGGGADQVAAGHLTDDGAALLAGGFSQTGVFDGHILVSPTGGGENAGSTVGYLLRMSDPVKR